MGVEDDLRKTEVRKEEEVRVIETSKKRKGIIVFRFYGKLNIRLTRNDAV